jgi:ADP-L-glycero-D-manno-heptose 6-epimerase
MLAGQRPRIFTDGEQKRDFVYIDDVVAANLAAMNAKSTGVFNVGSGSAASFNRVVFELNRVLKTDLQPDYIDNPYAFFQTWTEADLARSREILRFQPRFGDIKKGIDAYHATGQLGA